MKHFENSGKYLKRIRLEARLSQKEMANKLGIHSQYISNCERFVCLLPPKALIGLDRKFSQFSHEVFTSMAMTDAAMKMKGELDYIFSTKGQKFKGYRNKKLKPNPGTKA